MILIRHRINSINELLNIHSDYGVEIDLRSLGQELILEHDPFKNGTKFSEWLKHYHHKYLIVNLKEDGLETKAINILNGFGIRNFFFLDQSFPSLYKISRITPEFCSARVSDFEPICSALSLKPGWIWFDSHSGDWEYLRDAFLALENQNIKTCLVSPELQRVDSEIELVNLKTIIKEMSINFDAVCTKFPEIWSKR
jgi:hypothetical protein